MKKLSIAVIVAAFSFGVSADNSNNSSVSLSQWLNQLMGIEHQIDKKTIKAISGNGDKSDSSGSAGDGKGGDSTNAISGNG